MRYNTSNRKIGGFFYVKRIDQNEGVRENTRLRSELFLQNNQQ